MKITKFVHSCLLIEMPDPVNRTVLFDPGVFSSPSIDIDSLEYLDDIVITHEHPDHFDLECIKKLVEKFPNVRIKTPASLVPKLENEGLKPTADAVDGIEIFDAPHEEVKPIFWYPDNIGVHYIDLLTHPGDSFHITETKPVLALPITAPWGSTVQAVKLGLQLKPKHIIPIHDWHWRDEAREQMYESFETLFKESGITFHKMKSSEPIVINL
jgi:L-ascorbate metabolism protein UlaG (beta-lactamase superfamily)